MRFTLVLGLVLSLGASIVGCGDSGPSLAPVKGKVMMYGKPYEKGLVVFEPVGGGPAGTSRTDANGEFEIWSAGKKGAMIGDHKVVVTTIMDTAVETAPVAPASSDDPAYMSQAHGNNMSQYKAAEKMKEPIPAKYNKNSELKCSVPAGGTQFDIDIK
ncbi:hypothetical protein VN12_17995 [Pirellula sp. SH-Sr6A]|uniref:carboxypeptidase regulatory-like domain-containing protein n=1 Tax=Pirellula sp. SH-Sr6A TaxID=1632865 RepID=UPI00078C31FA|nr:carboxypeptidase regulatory-like domain-containing protein [Pirellula sp. SH-Sr6A]AMV34027.1 hypothetical protein VN12_17995 [Pirellula sp. SH-Sr6A]